MMILRIMSYGEWLVFIWDNKIIGDVIANTIRNEHYKHPYLSVAKKDSEYSILEKCQYSLGISKEALAALKKLKREAPRDNQKRMVLITRKDIQVKGLPANSVTPLTDFVANKDFDIPEHTEISNDVPSAAIDHINNIN